MTTFMDTMHGLLRGVPTPVDEEGILPGVQDMMRTMGNHGYLTHSSPFLPPIIQDLVDRGFALASPGAEPNAQVVSLTPKGRAYIARIGGSKARTQPTTMTISAYTSKPGDPPATPEEPA